MINILPFIKQLRESGIYHPYVKDRNKFLFSMVHPREKKKETRLKLNLEGVFTVNSFTCLASIFS